MRKNAKNPAVLGLTVIQDVLFGANYKTLIINGIVVGLSYIHIRTHTRRSNQREREGERERVERKHVIRNTYTKMYPRTHTHTHTYTPNNACTDM